MISVRLCCGLDPYGEPASRGGGAKIGSGAYVIGLISWAASEGSTVSSLICDHWLTHKLAMFVGLTDSLECSFSYHDQCSVVLQGWTHTVNLLLEGAERSPCGAWAGLVANLLSGGASLDLQQTYEEGAGPSPC